METLEESLKDLDIPQYEIDKISKLDKDEIIKVLNKYRKEYLKEVHEDEKKISLVDYILYKIGKESV